MKDKLNEIVREAAPALKAAFVKAAKVGAYIVLSAAITEAYALIGHQGFDPIVLGVVNTALASATKAISVLNGN